MRQEALLKEKYTNYSISSNKIKSIPTNETQADKVKIKGKKMNWMRTQIEFNVLYILGMADMLMSVPSSKRRRVSYVYYMDDSNDSDDEET